MYQKKNINMHKTNQSLKLSHGNVEYIRDGKTLQT